MRYAKSSLKKAPAKGKRVYRKRSTKPSKAFVKTVQSIIHKDVETKQTHHIFPLTAFNTAATASGDINFIIPSTAVGSAENERIGDDIRGQKLVIKGHMIQNVTGTLNYSRFAVRMLICQPKAYSERASITANAGAWLPYVLQKGGVSAPLDGTISSLYAPVDHNVITCYYDKTFYLTVPFMNTFVGEQDVSQTVKFFSKTFNLKNKLLRYAGNFNSNLYPLSYSPCILLSYTALNGYVPTIDSDTNVSMAFSSTLYYEDA